MRLSLAVVVAVNLITAGPAVAAVPLQPTGKWVVEYADNMCVLQRNYGTADKPLVLSLRPSPLTDYLNLYVFDARTGQSGDFLTAQIEFGPGQKKFKKGMYTFDIKGTEIRYNGTGLWRSMLEQSIVSGQISIRSPRQIDVAFQVPSLKSALDVLDDCIADLLDEWGLKRADQKAIARQAESSRALFDSSDYPRKAFLKDSKGQNSARVWVDVNGRASDCVIVEASGDQLLDDAICKGLLTGRFSPARDRAGQPVRTIYFARVRWVIPR